MFEDLQRALRNLERNPFSVPVPDPVDDEGYVDRECPAKDCQFVFKVSHADWRSPKVKDEAVHCPSCGHIAESSEWATTQNVERAKKNAIAQVSQSIDSAMRRDASNWNRRQPSGGFLKITMSVSGGPRHFSVPALALQPMQRKLECSVCSCRYAVIGSAFFCPGCGHDDVLRDFHQAMQRMLATLEQMYSIRSAMDSADAAADINRYLVEGFMQSTVTAFERVVGALFAASGATTKVRRGAFQNLSEGGSLWEAQFGHDFSSLLSGFEWLAINRYFQQRHLLAHREGMVDAAYVSHTADITYQIGQRLIVRESAVREFLQLVEKLVKVLEQDVAGP